MVLRTQQTHWNSCLCVQPFSKLVALKTPETIYKFQIFLYFPPKYSAFLSHGFPVLNSPQVKMYDSVSYLRTSLILK